MQRQHININIVECKLQLKENLSKVANDININIVECKW